MNKLSKENSIQIFRVRISKFAFWIIIAAAFDLTIPFLFGRQLAFSNGKQIVSSLPDSAFFFTTAGWLVATLMLSSFLLYYIRPQQKFWMTICFICFGIVQFFSGFCFMRSNFYDANYIVFGNLSHLPNATNVGILAAFFAFGLFITYYVITLFATQPNTKLAILVDLKICVPLFIILELLFLGIFNTPNVLNYYDAF